MPSKYITSELDGKSYCITNGAFKRHLTENGITKRQYIEQYVTGVIELCPVCGDPKSFDEKYATYGKTCGHKCSKKFIWMNTTQEEKEEHTRKVKAGYKNRTEEQNEATAKQRKNTCIEKYGVEHHMKSSEFTDKIATTNLERYGSVSPLTNEEVKVKIAATNLALYGAEHPMHSAELKTRMQNTNIERYGFKSSLSNERVKEKIDATNLERYGDVRPARNDSVKQKLSAANIISHGTPQYKDNMKRVCMEKYGVEYISQNKEVRKKIKETTLEKYGVAHVSQNIEIQNKIKKTNLERYGYEHFSAMRLPIDVVAKLTDNKWMTEKYTESRIIGIMNEFDLSRTSVNRYLNKANVLRIADKSEFEQEVCEYIVGMYSGEVISNNRSVLGGTEIDIYLPELKLAFECDGSYWHSELNGKDKNYHKKKTEQCAELGIRLVHIWGHDWTLHKDKYKSLISGIFGNNTSIYARKCTIIKLSLSETAAFLNTNHRQGTCMSSINVGLVQDGVLCAVMTFSKSRYNKKYEYELIRYCSMLYTNVIGGASKLFAYFCKTYCPSSVISYSDISLNSGELYHKLGFTLSHVAPPAYHYTKDHLHFENRVVYQKHKLKEKLEVFDPSLTEWQNMQNNGFDRIWDCGQKVYSWHVLKI